MYWDSNLTACKNCHGGLGEGAFGPDLAGRGLNTVQVLRAVRQPWGIMPRFTGTQLSGQQAADVAAYFAGELTDFDIELDFAGTEFQRRVWTALLTIPYGQTRSYGEIAEQIGAPGAARAVGLANGHNPIAIIVPCHRVIGANGSLTGFGGGLGRKRTLLELEKQKVSMALTLFD